jgi:hypothetical protein
MQTLFAFHGVDCRPSLEAVVQRWLTRLETVQTLDGCAVSVRVHWSLLGLGKRASVELAASDESGEVCVSCARRLREDVDLYLLVADAFRELRQRLAERQLAATAEIS